MKDQILVERSLLEAVAHKIKRFGFAASLRNQSFYRKFSDGKHGFHIAFVRYDLSIDVTADVAIRFDKLEYLIHENSPNVFLSKRDKSRTFSIGAELGRISGTGQKRWTITDVTDVPQVSDEIVVSFQTLGLPYLEQYSDLGLVFEILAEITPSAELLNPIPLKQAKNALALSHLLNSSRQREITDKFVAYLNAVRNSGFEGFIEFAKKLNFEKKSSD